MFLVNINCQSCDFRKSCRRTIKTEDGKKVLAKEQDFFNMPCYNVVQDICRDCLYFINTKCASWKVLNGRKTRTNLIQCPKKIPYIPDKSEGY